MKKKFTSRIFIDGQQVLKDSGFQVKLTQHVEDHHRFSITFLARRTEGFSATLMDNSLSYIGKKLSIDVSDELEFVGIITNVALTKSDGAEGEITISGYSPTIMLSNSYQCFSYEEGRSFEEVMQDTLKGYPGDLIRTNFGSNTGIALPYTVQYNESDYAFIKRVCRRYGIWHYYNGKEFCIGRTGEREVKGTYGEAIKQFGLSASLQEQQFSLSQHDWVNNTLLQAESSAYTPNGNHPYVSTVKRESDNVYGKAGNYFYLHGHPEYEGQKGLDTYTQAVTRGHSSGMLTASGISQMPELRLGDTLSVKGYNFERLSQRDTYGKFMITGLVHTFDHSGEYRNRFEAVPDKSPYSFSADAYSYPRAETQRAIVKDNADPDGLGRVKVQFPWQQEKNTTTPWIKLQTPYGGAEKGFYFVPETEEEVLVGFEGGNAERPYVISAGYNKDAKSPFADGENNIKAIQTRSGHLIELNDSDSSESITITDKNSNTIYIDTANNNITISAKNDITVSATETMTFNAKNMNINVEENMDVNVGKDKTEHIGETLEVTSNTKIEEVGQEMSLYVQEALTQMSGEATIETNHGDMVMRGAGVAVFQGGVDVKISKG